MPPQPPASSSRPQPSIPGLPLGLVLSEGSASEAGDGASDAEDSAGGVHGARPGAAQPGWLLGRSVAHSWCRACQRGLAVCAACRLRQLVPGSHSSTPPPAAGSSPTTTSSQASSSASGSSTPEWLDDLPPPPQHKVAPRKPK
jgi:hypothetical protein